MNGGSHLGRASMWEGGYFHVFQRFLNVLEVVLIFNIFFFVEKFWVVQN